MDYASTAARFLLGVTAHPGGERLSRHLLDRLGLPPGSVAADVACGRGRTVELLRDRGVITLGLDLTSGDVRADAHRLPLRSGSLDAVLLECSLSTFDHPEQALAEVARVLRPGGQLGLTDVLLHRDLASPAVVAAVDRLTHARTLHDYAALCQAQGLDVTLREDRQRDALTLLRRLRTRLPLSRTVRACEGAVRSGTLGYGLLVAERRR